MIRDEHIDTAVAQGLLTARQAAQLRALAAGEAVTPDPLAPHEDPDDERFRLIGGFNDVFVTTGILLLVSALFGLTSTLGFGVGFAIIALAAAWGLSEVFARRLRLALPAITLSIMFAVAGGTVAYMLAGGASLAAGLGDPEQSALRWTLFGVGSALAAAIHRWRFDVPIDTALLAAGLVCAVVGGFAMIDPAWTEQHRSILFALLGGGVFVAATYIDATDTARLTRRSDIAFWLHLLAAPMLVQAVTSLLFGSTGDFNSAQAIGVLVLFGVFGLIALILDRRALLVSGLSYAGVAIGYLLSESLNKDASISLTLLGLAALVLLLSVQWRSLRRAVLALFPNGRLRHLVPPAS